MAVRLEVVVDNAETTETLEHGKPVEIGRRVLGTVLVLVAAAAAVGVWHSFAYVGLVTALVLEQWAKL
jgi:hypothetical protein